MKLFIKNLIKIDGQEIYIDESTILLNMLYHTRMWYSIWMVNNTATIIKVVGLNFSIRWEKTLTLSK